MSEFLPCPFCGVEPQYNMYFAWCTGPEDEPHQLVQMAWDRWNVRAPSEGDLIAALTFYSDPSNWVPGRWSPDDDAGDDVVQNLICMGTQEEEMGSVPIADCGDRARKAIALRNERTRAGGKP